LSMKVKPGRPHPSTGTGKGRWRRTLSAPTAPSSMRSSEFLRFARIVASTTRFRFWTRIWRW
jgi:hypothetical protein